MELLFLYRTYIRFAILLCLLCAHPIVAMDAKEAGPEPDGLVDQECGGTYHPDHTLELIEQVVNSDETVISIYRESSWTRLNRWTVPPTPLSNDNQGFIYELILRIYDQEIARVRVYIGYAHEYNIQGTHAWISGLFVNPRYRRQGYARRLLMQIPALLAQGNRSSAGSLILNVHNGAENEAAIRLYTGEGFNRIYDSLALAGSSDYVMQKMLR